MKRIAKYLKQPTEDHLIKAVDSLLIAAIFMTTCAVLELINSVPQHLSYNRIHQIQAELGRNSPPNNPETIPHKTNLNLKTANPTMVEWSALQNKLGTIQIIYTVQHCDYLGEYFITAYCPEECGGSWRTSSGATCHYSSDPSIPTTCAIDKNLHQYGDLLMIGGKIYVAEDTGPGVRGRWVDCFVESMAEVRAFDTRYTSVYSIRYTKHTITPKEQMCLNEWLNYYRLCNMSDAWTNSGMFN